MPTFNNENLIDTVKAAETIAPIIHTTPLYFHKRLSDLYNCNVWLKREDMQPVRSYKLRGAFNKILSLSESSRKKGVVCASAGNHAQGVAYSCHHLQLRAHIFMPANTPDQKLQRVKTLGGSFVNVILHGDTYDEAAASAIEFATENEMELVPPFDDVKVIEGQSTIAKEILHEQPHVDYVFMPVGGGGLAAGLSHYFHQHSHSTKLIGVEPAGAASMTAAFEKGNAIALDKIDPFVDGAAVRKVGELTYVICKNAGLQMMTVEEGHVCSTLLQLYNEDGILVEPAGALSVAALDSLRDAIINKNIVCILSGSNNDSNRMDDIKKLAHAWEGKQHHLVIRFLHNPDGLKTFFTEILGPDDYVNRIEYMRRDHGRSTYALVGLRSSSKVAYQSILDRMHGRGIEFNEVSKEDFLFKYWV